MKAALACRPPTTFQAPSGITWAEIDRETGKLAHPGCPLVFNEAFAAGTEPTEICPLQHDGTDVVLQHESVPAVEQ